MANSKISELPLATTISFADIVPIVSEGITKKMTIQTLTSLRGFDKIYTNTVLSSTNTGLEEKIFCQLLIPANTLSNNKFIELNNVIISLSSNSTWTVNVWFSTQVTLGTGIKVAEFTSTATVFWKNFKRTFWTKNNTIVGLNNTSSQISDDGSNTGQQPPIVAQTINYGVNNYFYFTVQFGTIPLGIGTVNSQYILAKIY